MYGSSHILALGVAGSYTRNLYTLIIRVLSGPSELYNRAPVSKKAKVARGKARHAGKFEKEKLDDQLAEIDDAVDLSDSDEEAIDFLDACDDAANWLLLVAPLRTLSAPQA